MTVKKESWLRKNMNIMLIIFILSSCITGYITYERNKDSVKITHDSIESRIPEDVKTFVEWEKHMNEKPSDVETDRMHRRNLEVGDSLLILSKKQEAQQLVLTEQLKILDTFRIYMRSKDLKDSIVEVKKQVSRDKRTDDMEVLTATMLIVLKKVGAIQDSIN